MSIKKITADEIYQNSMERYSNRPTAASRTGIGGLTPDQLKKAYDLLALLGIEKVNELIGIINADASPDSIAGHIKTPIVEDSADGTAKSLYDVLLDLVDGDIAGYLALTGLLENNLQDELARLEKDSVTWTPEKQKEIVDGVLAALPVWEGGSY